MTQDVIFMSYHHVPIGGSWSELDSDARRVGHVHSSRELLNLCTGIAMGNLRIEWRPMTNAPGEPDLDGWQDVVEVSLYSEDGEITGQDRITNSDTNSPVLSLAGPGWYRVRCSARGMDLEWDATAFVASKEEHLVEIWPAPFSEPIVHKLTSTNAQRWSTADE